MFLRGVSTNFPSLANNFVEFCTKFAILGEGVLGSSCPGLQWCHWSQVSFSQRQETLCILFDRNRPREGKFVETPRISVNLGEKHFCFQRESYVCVNVIFLYFWPREIWKEPFQYIFISGLRIALGALCLRCCCFGEFWKKTSIYPTQKLVEKTSSFFDQVQKTKIAFHSEVFLASDLMLSFWDIMVSRGQK